MSWKLLRHLDALTELLLATRNENKISEIKNCLGELSLRILTFKEMRDFPVIIEDGKSLYENALKKAKNIATFFNKLTLADDSGLEVDFLLGKPGVFSSRFAGISATYEDNNKKLLKLLLAVTRNRRKAQFKCVMVISSPDRIIGRFEGLLKGEILEKGRGEGGFGYDPVFYVDKYGKTLAELTLSEKNEISHRGIALRKVQEFLKENNSVY